MLTAPKRAAAGVTVAPPGREFRIAVHDGYGWNLRPGRFLSRTAADAEVANINAATHDVRIVLRPAGWSGES